MSSAQDDLTLENVTNLYHQFFNNEEERFKYLRMFIRWVLDPIIDYNQYPDMYEAILSPDNLRIWEKVFTHSSYDPINNYETLETLGDVVLGNIFVNILIEAFGNAISARYITLTKNYYMAQEEQIRLAEKFHFDKMIRVGSSTKLVRKMSEDVFEAFFGALTRIVDTLTYDEYFVDGTSQRILPNRGDGYRLAYVLLTYVLGDITIIDEADPITKIKEAYDMLKNERNVQAPSIKSQVYTKKNGDEFIRFFLVENILNDYGKVISQREWPVSTEGPIDDQATLKRQLGEKGLEYMASQGYDEKLINDIRQRREDVLRELPVLLEQFQKIANEHALHHIKENSSITGHTWENLPTYNNIHTVKFIIKWVINGKQSYTIGSTGSGDTRSAAQIDALKKWIDRNTRE